MDPGSSDDADTRNFAGLGFLIDSDRDIGVGYSKMIHSSPMHTRSTDRTVGASKSRFKLWVPRRSNLDFDPPISLD